MLVDSNNFKMTEDNLYLFAYTNISELKGKNVKGIVLNFHGLGGGTQMEDDVPMAKYYTDRDTVIVLPYCGPWNWMNSSSIKIIDMIIDTIIDVLNLDKNIPVIPTGGSMGGMGGLVYSIYSKHHIAACAVSCAVCDMPYHFIETYGVQRTILAAFASEECGFENALVKFSPLHQIDKLPRVPYFIASCELDDDVHMVNHSEVLVPKMKAMGHDVTYIVEKGRGHVDLSSEVSKQYLDFPLDVLFGKHKKVN